MRTAQLLLLIALTGLAVGCSKNKPTDDPGTGSDSDRLQGMWAIESFEAPNPTDRPGDDELRGVRFVFEGDKLRITHGGREEQTSGFVLDTASNPKVMILTRLGDDGRPRRKLGPKGEGEGQVQKIEAIYKFDADTLVLAMPEGPGADRATRPTEFKPKARGTDGPGGSSTPDVFVVRFKKTTEAAKPAEDRPTRPGAVPTRVVKPTTGTGK